MITTDMVNEAVDLQNQIEKLSDRLNELKNTFSSAVSKEEHSGNFVGTTGSVDVVWKKRVTLKTNDTDKLKNIFGDLFNKYFNVKTVTVVEMTKEMKKMVDENVYNDSEVFDGKEYTAVSIKNAKS